MIWGASASRFGGDTGFLLFGCVCFRSLRQFFPRRFALATGVLFSLLLGGIERAQAQQQRDASGFPDEAASIYGGLVDEAGAGVPGAKVILTRVSGSKLNLPFSSQSTISDGGGLFSFTKLPSGLYKLCPSQNGGDLLNPCEWFDNPPAVPVLTGRTKAGVRIAMVRGRLLNIRIDDDEKKLKKDSKGQVNDFIRVRVRTPRGSREVPRSSADADGQNHLIAVPVGVALQLDVVSSGLDIRGRGPAQDVHVNEGPSIANGKQPATFFDIKSQEAGKEFRFAVKGKAK